MPCPELHSRSTFTPGSLLDNYPPDHLLLLNPKLSANPNHRRTLSSIDTPGASRNSSLQKVWAEDYYNIDYSSEGEREYTDQGVRERAGEQHPAAQPFPGSIDFESEQEHEPPAARPARTHQRSLTALLPFRSPTRTSSKSPERKSPQQSPRQDLDECTPDLAGDKEGVIKVADKPKSIASWFTGSSAPVLSGISVGEDADMALTGDNPERPKKRPTLSTAESSSSTNTTPAKKANAGWGVGNFFLSPKTPSKPATIQLPAHFNDDEFLTLDIKSALFPAGPPSPQDPFSPAAFKNLQQQAEGLLQKLQTAYKLRTQSLHELRAEKETMEEELDEARTRNNVLKTNLSDMAHQVSDKDTTIAELMSELTKEKQARALEKEARETSIKEVRELAGRDAAKRGSTSDLSIDTFNEDLGIAGARRHRKRQSGLTDTTDFTEGDSDGESALDRDSTFSRARSPVNSMVGTVDTTPEIMQATFGKMVPNPTHTSGFAKRPPMVQQKSLFQKALGRITNGSDGSDDTVIGRSLQKDRYDGIGMGETGCSNCRGKDSSVAWETVGMMREENKGLKDRLYDMEKAVEQASDMCAGWFSYNPLEERLGDGSYGAAKCLG